MLTCCLQSTLKYHLFLIKPFFFFFFFNSTVSNPKSFHKKKKKQKQKQKQNKTQTKSLENCVTPISEITSNISEKKHRTFLGKHII